jgi:hypothetical protein
MAFFPKDSRIKETAALKDAISKAGSTLEIQALLHQAEFEQKLIERDPFDNGSNPDYYAAHPVETPQATFSRQFTVNGVAHTITADSAEGLVAAELAEMKNIFSAAPAAAAQPRTADGRFSAEDKQRLAVLEAQAVLDAADPINKVEQDIVERALRARGIDPDALAEFSAKKKSEDFMQSWADAGAEFTRQTPDWIGGEENKNTLARIVASNNLQDAADKVAVLQAAYEFGLKEGMFTATPEQLLAERLSNAQSSSEIAEILGKNEREMNAAAHSQVNRGGFWGGR